MPNISNIYKSLTAIEGCGTMAKALSTEFAKKPDALVSIQNSSEESSLKTVKALQKQYVNGARFLANDQASQVEVMRLLNENPSLEFRAIDGMKPDYFRAKKPEEYQSIFHNPKTTHHSPMAGVKNAEVAAKFPNIQSFIRSMGNTPAAIGQGVTALMTFGKDTVTTQNFLSEIKAAGIYYMLTEEDQFHGATGVSGSGPGFADYLLESLESLIESINKMPSGSDKALAINLLRHEIAKELPQYSFGQANDAKLKSYLPHQLPEPNLEAVHQNTVHEMTQGYIAGVIEAAKTTGLDEPTTRLALYGTLLGSATYYEKSDASLETLKDEVAGKKKAGHPGGTTRAGLNVLDSYKQKSNGPLFITQEMMYETTLAAAKRSEELAEPEKNKAS